VALVMAAPVAALVVGLAPVLVTELVGLVGVLAWEAGRNYQHRLDARAHVRHVVGGFVGWAEEVLASAPEDMDAEQEEVRSRLQRDYQEAQRLLRKLDG
jgi:hypothetical protein